MKRLAQLALLLMAVAPVVAQDLPMRYVQADDYPYITPVTIAKSSNVVISEEQRLLAFAHEADQPVDISIFALDESGKPGELPTVQITLPEVTALKDRNNYVLDLRLHPKLPLLYVFRDIQKPDDAEAELSEAYDKPNRLLVYRIEAKSAKLLQSLLPGEPFWKGSAVGFIELDMQWNRLFVSNLFHITPGQQNHGIAILQVGEDGLIAMDDSKQPKMQTYYAGNFYTANCAGGFAIIDEDTFVWASHPGPSTIEISGQDITTSYHWLWPPRYSKRMALHPTLPVMYFTNINQAYIQMIEHADGYPTLLPTYATATGPLTQPIVMAEHNLVAMGGKYNVGLLAIDETGRYTGEVYYPRVEDPEVYAVVWSPKFERLYVSQEPKP